MKKVTAFFGSLIFFLISSEGQSQSFDINIGYGLDLMSNVESFPVEELEENFIQYFYYPSLSVGIAINKENRSRIWSASLNTRQTKYTLEYYNGYFPTANVPTIILHEIRHTYMDLTGMYGIKSGKVEVNLGAWYGLLVGFRRDFTTLRFFPIVLGQPTPAEQTRIITFNSKNNVSSSDAGVCSSLDYSLFNNLVFRIMVRQGFVDQIKDVLDQRNLVTSFSFQTVYRF